MATQYAQLLSALRAGLDDAIAARGLSARRVVLRLPESAVATAYQILAGPTRDPRTSILLALCRAIDIDPNELLGAHRPALEPEAEGRLDRAEFRALLDALEGLDVPKARDAHTTGRPHAKGRSERRMAHLDTSRPPLLGGPPTKSARSGTLRNPRERRPAPRPGCPPPAAYVVACLLVRRPDPVPEEERVYPRRLRDHEPAIATAHELAQEFADMARERQGRV